MKPEVEGRGGGYGKYEGRTIAEIQALFDTCIADPSMRSISAVLRITREQLESRGQLGVYPLLAWIAAIASVLGLVVRQYGPSSLTEFGTKAAMGSGSAFVLLLVSTFPTRHARKVNLQQERVIRERAVQALVQILEHKPALKPLTMEQETTVKILLRKTQNSQGIKVLL